VNTTQALQLHLFADKKAETTPLQEESVEGQREGTKVGDLGR